MQINVYFKINACFEDALCKAGCQMWENKMLSFEILGAFFTDLNRQKHLRLKTWEYLTCFPLLIFDKAFSIHAFVVYGGCVCFCGSIIIWQNATGCCPHLLQCVFTVETNQDHWCIFKMAETTTSLAILLSQRKSCYTSWGKKQIRVNPF